MELPFTPSFFKRIEMFQRLMDHQKEGKPTWEAEMLVLEWAASPHHAEHGSAIGNDHINNIIVKAVNEKKVSSKGIKNSNPTHVRNSLVVRGFAEHKGEGKILFNRDGFLAGSIIEETDRLRKTRIIRAYLGLWWGIFIVALILLLFQTGNLIAEVFF